MYILSDKISFPPVTIASLEGIVAIGGDLSVERLLLAYKSGIFPWYNEGEDIHWYCPDPRFVLFPEDIKVSKSMKKYFNRDIFQITYNKAFDQVIHYCQDINRKAQDGTWITQEMKKAYLEFHSIGIATSVEVWDDKEQLVGGLYGVKIGKIFYGESMFSLVSNASKFAIISLCDKLKKENFKLIDCQVYTNHLASLGAQYISKEAFLQIIK